MLKSEIAFNDLNLNSVDDQIGHSQVDNQGQFKQNTNSTSSTNNNKKGTSNSELLAAIKPLAQIEMLARLLSTEKSKTGKRPNNERFTIL